MEVVLPHELGRDEVRRRLKGSAHRIGENIPGGMAEVVTDWPSEDRMNMSIQTMGQLLQGFVDIEDERVVFCIDLPPALGFIRPIVESSIRDQGQRMLAPPD